MSEVQRIEQLIKEHGITKRALAKQLEIPESTLFSWFISTKPKKMKDTAIKKFADFFGVSFEYLKTGQGEPVNNELQVKVPVLSDDTCFETVAFPIDYFKLKNVKTTDCKIYVFKGQSLAPYINNGDKLLLNMHTTYVEDQCLYALFFSENEFICRKVQKNHFTDELTLYTLDGKEECSFSCSDFHTKVTKLCKVLCLVRDFN